MQWTEQLAVWLNGAGLPGLLQVVGEVIKFTSTGEIAPVLDDAPPLSDIYRSLTLKRWLLAKFKKHMGWRLSIHVRTRGNGEYLAGPPEEINKQFTNLLGVL
jgi:hypothetical protein